MQRWNLKLAVDPVPGFFNLPAKDRREHRDHIR
jgi:hypothetical protein